MCRDLRSTCRMALEQLTMANSSRPSLRERIFATSARKKQQDVVDRDRDRDSARRVPFYRRKAAPSAPSSSSQSLAKRSFLSKVVTKVVPCVSAPITPVDLYSNGTVLKDLATPDLDLDLDLSPPLAAGFSITPSSSAPPSPVDSDVVVPPPVSATLLPQDETDGMTSGAVQPPGSSGTTDMFHTPTSHVSHDSDSDRTSFSEDENVQDELDEEERLIRNGGSGIPVDTDGQPRPLLPPVAPEHVGRKCLVLDLDETLVHSSFKEATQPADFIVPVEIEYHWHHFHVLKRPGVDEFLRKMGELFEVVIFTASLSKYADPVLDKLDTHRVVAHRLFRESCFNHKGNYVKDLSQLGRPIGDTIILDNSPASYIFHPHNAVPVSSWFNDPHDAELTDLVPFLRDLMLVPDVRNVLDGAC